MGIRCGAALFAVLAALSCATAHADAQMPQVDGPCRAEIDGAMTLLADGQTYALCQQVAGGYGWTPVQTPFEPNNTWLSYGPAITLHGQGMRNPNLLSGNWTATPLDPDATCRAEEQTVVEAGVLSDPQVFVGEPGAPLALSMPPRLFYLTLSGHCLWTRN